MAQITPVGYLVLPSNQKIVVITAPGLIGMEAASGLHLWLCLHKIWMESRSHFLAGG